MNMKINRIKIFPTNIYLLSLKKGYLMIDTSFYSKFNILLKKLKKYNIKLKDIRYIFLTHYHDDHAGMIKKILDETNAKLILHKNSLPVLKRGTFLNYSPEGRLLNPCVKFISYLHSKIIKRDYKFPPIKQSDRLIIIKNDNSSLLKSIGIEGKILYTPGHTIDSISLVLDNGYAFVGDVCMNLLKFCNTKYYPLYAEDYSIITKSWEKLLKNGAKIIYPAHGKEFSAIKLKKFINHKN